MPFTFPIIVEPNTDHDRHNNRIKRVEMVIWIAAKYKSEGCEQDDSEVESHFVMELLALLRLRELCNRVETFLHGLIQLPFPAHHFLLD